MSLGLVAATAARLVAQGEGEVLVVLPLSTPTITGEQDDDGVRAVAAIDVLHWLTSEYEARETGNDE
jgi:hypothetical protein